MRRNPCEHAVIGELRRAGIADYQVEYGKHRKIVLEHNGQRRMVVVPNTPSDRFGPRRAAADVRRTLRT